MLLEISKNNSPLYFGNLFIKANTHINTTRNQDLYKCRIKHDIITFLYTVNHKQMYN